MAELKRYVVHFKSKAGDQRVALLARNQAEAEILAQNQQTRRAGRYRLTMENLQKGGMNFAQMSKEQRLKELDRRKRDFSRYDIVLGDDVHAAEAPLKLNKIEERK